MPDRAPAFLRLLGSCLFALSASAPGRGYAADHRELATKAPPYRGAPALALEVDLRDARRRIVTVRERIPLQQAGRLVLLYPQWDAASHAPSIPVQRLAGLAITADGAPLPWRRDPARVHAFEVVVPEGARELQVEFQYLAPLRRDPAATVLQGVIGLAWNRVLLYPEGRPAHALPVQATLTLPEGWSAATSLQGVRKGTQLRFAPVTLDRLVDAPVYAARAITTRAITHGTAPVRAHWIARDAASIQQAAAFDRPLRAVARESEALFGRAPFERYDFLLALDDRLPGPGGIEHADSGEVFLPGDFLSTPSAAVPYVDVIAHELIHAWNGRWRVPADMAADTPNDPVTGTLLWFYEGQTEFWSRVVAARSGLRSRQETLDALALDAAVVQSRAGRRWKSLADSTNDPLMPGGAVEWRDWQRREDYYVEGVLFWLDVDARLRTCSGGAKGMDDFAALFFDASGRRPGERERRYAESDVVATLAQVCAADWHAILRRKLDAHDDHGLLDGLRAHGWTLVFRDAPSAYFLANEAADGVRDLTWSLGMTIAPSGVVRSVAWDGAAFAAGIVPGARVERVDGTAFTPEALERALAGAAPRARLQLVVVYDGDAAVVDVDASRGRRYPHLQRIDGVPDTLSALLAPRRERE